MKYIKTYEQNIEPQVGDYVICQDGSYSVENNYEKKTFISNNIGKIIKYDTGSASYPYIVYYETAPSNYFTMGKTRPMGRNEIMHFSKNKEDCEIYLAAKKYNL